jgi:hypothetical protein
MSAGKRTVTPGTSLVAVQDCPTDRLTGGWASVAWGMTVTAPRSSPVWSRQSRSRLTEMNLLPRRSPARAELAPARAPDGFVRRCRVCDSDSERTQAPAAAE